MASALPAFDNFDSHLSSSDVATKWLKWISRFRNLMTAMDINNDVRCKALLLHYMGDETLNIYESVILPEALEGETETDRVIRAMSDYFSPRSNREYEIFKFRKLKQETGEDISSFFSRLKLLSVPCGFTDVNAELKSQLIQGCVSTKLRRKALSDQTVTLEQLVAFGRAQEMADIHATDMEGSHNSASSLVNRINTAGRKNLKSNKPDFSNVKLKVHHKPKRSSPTSVSSRKQCFKCGNSYPHKDTVCPAQGKTCYKCQKKNHFADMCHSKYGMKKQQYKNSVKYVTESFDSCDLTCDESEVSNKSDTVCDTVYSIFSHKICEHSDDVSEIFCENALDIDGLFNDEITCRSCDDSDETVYSITCDKKTSPVFTVSVNDETVEILADSGASVNLIDQNTYNQMVNKPKLCFANAKIMNYSGQKVPIMGKFRAVIKFKDNVITDDVFVARCKTMSLLGWSTCVKLGLLRTVNNVSNHDTKLSNLICEYSDLFEGLGRLKDCKVKLHINESVKPVAQQHRRIPFHVRKQVEMQLRHDEESGIIEKASGPTPWVSPVVIVPKPKSSDIRICVDMRAANMAISRERHPTPTVNDIINDLNGATCFSKLDLSQGYNQVELDESSRYITTFATHMGLYRYKRLCFGISSAAEVFQNAVREALTGLNGVMNISDDMILYGKTPEEHYENLRKCLQRLREKGLKLNKAKCVFGKKNLDFFGYTFSERGMSIDSKKLRSILDMSAPSNVTELRSLLGMINFSARFIPNYSTLTEPLRKLTHNDVAWNWTSEQQNALVKLKELLTSAPVLSYFDVNKSTCIYSDASPVGLGSILTQIDNVTGKESIVAFASRSLSTVEQRYSQIERELLGITWACEHFNLYVYGKHFLVLTDHKPLINIFENKTCKLSARMERWLLKLQAYDKTVKYIPGKTNPADYLSRHPVIMTCDKSHIECDTECYVNYVIDNSVPVAMTLSEVKEAYKSDKTLQAVMQACCTGKWYYFDHNSDINLNDFKIFHKVRDKLTVDSTNTVLLKNNKLVIPAQLRQQSVILAHQGHQGIVKTKSLLREKVWFPGIDKYAEECVKSCIACQASYPVPKKEPLCMSELPTAPWTELSCDFGQVGSNEYLLIVVDDYSRYPLVEVVSSTSSQAVIPKLDKMFAEFGTPLILKSDNGPPFNGNEFRKFASMLGFRHRKITPLWPAANGEVERFVRTVKKVIHTAKIEHKNWKQELQNFLRNYRATPHATTEVAPATILFGRSMQIKLPEYPKYKQTVSDHELRLRDTEKKQRMKLFADNKSYVKPCNIQIGDSVLVKNNPDKAKQYPYNPKPLIVRKKNGTMITAERDNTSITRNSSYFKKCKPGIVEPPDNEESDPDEEITFENNESNTNDVSYRSDSDNKFSEQRVVDRQIKVRPKRQKRLPLWHQDYCMK